MKTFPKRKLQVEDQGSVNHGCFCLPRSKMIIDREFNVTENVRSKHHNRFLSAQMQWLVVLLVRFLRFPEMKQYVKVTRIFLNLFSQCKWTDINGKLCLGLSKEGFNFFIFLIRRMRGRKFVFSLGKVLSKLLWIFGSYWKFVQQTINYDS